MSTKVTLRETQEMVLAVVTLSMSIAALDEAMGAEMLGEARKLADAQIAELTDEEFRTYLKEGEKDIAKLATGKIIMSSVSRRLLSMQREDKQQHSGAV